MDGLGAGCALIVLAFSCGVDQGLPTPGQVVDEEVGLVASELRKGTPGAANGDGNYCDDPAHSCGPGEGDCDRSEQCTAGNVCGRDNGPHFGMRAGIDVCVPEYCTHKDRGGYPCGGACGSECGPPACLSLPMGHTAKCLGGACACASGEGDCDVDGDCAPGLVCGRDNGAFFGFAPGSDVCVPPHCANLRRDAGETAIDCGGECGSVACVERGCLGSSVTYALEVTTRSIERSPNIEEETCYTVAWTRTIPVSISAANGFVSVTGELYAGTYPVVEETTHGFRARAGGDWIEFPCRGGFFGEYQDSYGLIEISVACGTGAARLSARCIGDNGADGCFPNYEETASGVGYATAQ